LRRRLKVIGALIFMIDMMVKKKGEAVKRRIIKRLKANGTSIYEPQKKFLFWWVNEAPGMLFYQCRDALYYQNDDWVVVHEQAK